QLRRVVLAAQGYTPRFRKATEDEVEATVRRLTAVQLDSISTVDRAHKLTISARAGAIPQGDVADLLRSGRLFEYWAHEACLLPIELWPFFRRTMENTTGHWGIFERSLRDHGDLVEAIVERIRAEGPLASRDFEGEKSGENWGWNWKPAKGVLEALWDRGVLVIAGRRHFQRSYDLAE